MQRSSSLPAACAQADDFDRLAFDSKADIVCAADNRVADGFLLQLNGGVAVAANQELALVRVLGVAAANKSVE